MYGLIGKMITVPGKREALIEIMLEGIADMPGCLSYVVARDTRDPYAVWVTEVWDSAHNHRASLQLPLVKEVIMRAKPLIAGFDSYFETVPVGGHGLL